MQDDRSLALIDVDRRRLVRAATRLLGAAEAEDAVQDAYVRALEADGLELNVAQAWLLTVMRNLAVDRLRRRQRWWQWLADAEAAGIAGTEAPAPSAEMDAALAEEVAHALRTLVSRLAPADAALVLLHDVFEVDHADIARASGRSVAGSRQRLKRALSRLRQPGGGAARRSPADRDRDRDGGRDDDVAFSLFLLSLQRRDPQVLWAMLRQPPTSASASPPRAAPSAPAGSAVASTVSQVAGRFGLVLTLDGVTLCVVPLGAREDDDRGAVFARETAGSCDGGSGR